MTDAEVLILPDVLPISNSNLRKDLQSELDTKTKPIGALGRLENLALRIGLILGR